MLGFLILSCVFFCVFLAMGSASKRLRFKIEASRDPSLLPADLRRKYERKGIDQAKQVDTFLAETSQGLMRIHNRHPLINVLIAAILAMVFAGGLVALKAVVDVLRW